MSPHDNHFIAALLAPGPHRDLAEDDQIFEPLIGSWDLTVSWFDHHGQLMRREPGEWHFSWVLEGRAIQDIWIVPPRAARSTSANLYEYGTSLRFYDPQISAWRSTWNGPMHGVVRTFVARKISAEIVLETTSDTEPKMRWLFSDITEKSFSWRNEILDNGRWRLQQSFACRRL